MKYLGVSLAAIAFVFLERFKVEMPQNRRSEDESSKEGEADDANSIVDAA